MGRRRVQQMGPIGTSTRALAAQRTIAADKAHTRGRRRLAMRDGRRTRCRWRPICATTADAGRNERARRTSTTSASEPWARRNPKMDTWESDSLSEAQGQLLGFAVIFCHMSGIILQYHTNSTNSRSSSQQQSISRPTAPAASSKAERSPAVVILTGVQRSTTGDEYDHTIMLTFRLVCFRDVQCISWRRGTVENIQVGLLF